MQEPALFFEVAFQELDAGSGTEAANLRGGGFCGGEDGFASFMRANRERRGEQAESETRGAE